MMEHTTGVIMKIVLFSALCFLSISAFADNFNAYCDQDTSKVSEDYIGTQLESGNLDNVTEYQFSGEGSPDADFSMMFKGKVVKIIENKVFLFEDEHTGFEFTDSKKQHYILRWDEDTLEINSKNESQKILCYVEWC